jgi:hypothetical protein
MLNRRRSIRFQDTQSGTDTSRGEGSGGTRNYLREYSMSRQQSDLSTVTDSTDRSNAPLNRSGTTERNHSTNFLESMGNGIPGFRTRVSELLSRLNCCVQDNESDISIELEETSNKSERLQDGNNAISDAHAIYTRGVTMGRDRNMRERYKSRHPIDYNENDQIIVYNSNLMHTALDIGEWEVKYDQSSSIDESKSNKRILDEYKRFFQERILSEFHRRTGEKHPMEDILTQSNEDSIIDIASIRAVNIHNG